MMRNRSAVPNSSQPKEIFRDIHAAIVRYNGRFDDCNRFNKLTNLGWKISRSKISGNGIISTKVYQPGDVIFIDHPLVVGPRCSTQIKPVCVICYVTEGTLLKPCPNGCSLPICANCENNIAHTFECEFIRNRARADKINDYSYNLEILRSLAVIRCLKFDDLSREIVRQLHKIRNSKEFVEIELLKKNLDTLTKHEEYFMTICCQVMYANAHEIRFNDDRNVESYLRGLYPMASIMNHSCIPNTRRNIDSTYRMIIKATKTIAAGDEITSAYTSLFLATPARRNYLLTTKKFTCKCTRCRDPTEFGTNLSALKCRNTPCDSLILPEDPSNMLSSWKCLKCDYKLSFEKVDILQRVISNEISRLDTKSPAKILDFVQNNKILANTNHTIIRFKYVLLGLLGYDEEYRFDILSDDLLLLRKDICQEILLIAEKLALGECEAQKKCSQELRKTNEELEKRRVK